MHPTPDDGSHAFDFITGRWAVRHQRLKSRLSGCTDWETFDAECTGRQLPGAIGNTDESSLHAWRPGFVGISLRLYCRATGLWSIYWMDSANAGLVGSSGQLAPPVVGRFDDSGVGVFTCNDVLDGRPILVKYVWSGITPSSAHWQQAFSADGGATWETNWTMDHRRLAA